MCNRHYERERLSGRLEVDRRDPLTKFWSRVEKTSTCWVWTAAKANGYGRMQWNGRQQPTHRIAYELLVGPIPEGLEIDHLCRNRACCNPDHLEPVTSQVNMLRGETVAAANAAKDSCPEGHPYDEANTYLWRGNRLCLTCRHEMSAKRAERSLRDRRSTVHTRVCPECERTFQVVGNGKVKICSDACRKERDRRAAREYQRRKRAVA